MKGRIIFDKSFSSYEKYSTKLSKSYESKEDFLKTIFHMTGKESSINPNNRGIIYKV